MSCVCVCVCVCVWTGRVAVYVEAHPPDKRRRDLDNLWKGVLDAMQHAQVYVDDNQVDDLHIVRRAHKAGSGYLEVTLTAL